MEINRKELLAAVKELNASGITEKIKTKDLLEFPLLIMFLEAVESVPEGRPKEEDIPPAVIKYYNKMARKVEKMNNQAIMEYIENGVPIPEDTSEEINDVVDFVEREENVPTVTALKQITDIMETVLEEDKKDIFGLQISGKYHPVVKKLVNGKSEGFLIKKDIADKAFIKACIDMVKKKNPDVVVTKECVNGKFYYKFFGEKPFWKSKK